MRTPLVLAVVAAVVLLSGCSPAVQGADLECDYVSLGWYQDFKDTFDFVPEEAVQCDATEGSAVVIRAPAGLGADVGAFLKEKLLDDARYITGSGYYEKVCSSGDGLCVEDAVVIDGSLNAVGSLDGNPFLVFVSSGDPEDAEKVLEGLLQKKGEISGMLG